VGESNPLATCDGWDGGTPEVERNLESAEKDSERRRVAERDKLRLERFLVIAEGS